MSGHKRRWVFSDEEQDKWLGGPWAIIGDPSWYCDNEAEVTAWLDASAPGWYLSGTVIEFASRDQLTMFRLRWS